jgi:hypothetical protein
VRSALSGDCRCALAIGLRRAVAVPCPHQIKPNLIWSSVANKALLPTRLNDKINEVGAWP